LAVGLGAALTVLLATRFGLPVSTTHALTGGLVGAGLMASAKDVQLAALGRSFVLPLLFRPVVALLLTLVVYPLFRVARRRIGETAAAVRPTIGLALVAVAMAVGGLLNSRKVAETMSKKITKMTPGQVFTANLVTALLVTVASRLGLPVSTTHVSVGALFGIGVVTCTARPRTILTILLAWLTTLPLAAL